VLVVDSDAGLLGLARISWNAYQPVAFMHVPFIKEETAYQALLSAAIQWFKNQGKVELHLDIWEEQWGLVEHLYSLGARETGRWTYLIRFL
jgi:hypothetical protein